MSYTEIYDYLVRMAPITNQFSLTAIVQEGDPIEILLQPMSVPGDVLSLKISANGEQEIKS